MQILCLKSQYKNMPKFYILNFWNSPTFRNLVIWVSREISGQGRVQSVHYCKMTRFVNVCRFQRFNTSSYIYLLTKGQIISKSFFGVFTFFQKTNENKSTSSKVEFVRSFFGRNVGLKKSFRICLTFSNAKNAITSVILVKKEFKYHFVLFLFTFSKYFSA